MSTCSHDETVETADNRVYDVLFFFVLFFVNGIFLCVFKIVSTQQYQVGTVCATMAQMAHFSFPYYFTIPNSEFRNLHYEFRNSEL